MKIISLTDEYKNKVEEAIMESWSGPYIAVHRELFDLREFPCLIAVSEDNTLLGYCYYRIHNCECEVLAIESFVKNVGVGTALIEAVMSTAKDNFCKRLYLSTTNDITSAIRFYQRRGFTISAFKLNEIEYSRILKPCIPFLGEDDIPILHEIEFEIKLG
jgi:ribosomal protein S18 acetylase RimI-like enzyme